MPHHQGLDNHQVASPSWIAKVNTVREPRPAHPLQARRPLRLEAVVLATRGGLLDPPA